MIVIITSNVGDDLLADKLINNHVTTGINDINNIVNIHA